MTRNHKDTKTQRKPAPTIIDAGFLCVFVSLWFLIYEHFHHHRGFQVHVARRSATVLDTKPTQQTARRRREISHESPISRFELSAVRGRRPRRIDRPGGTSYDRDPLWSCQRLDRSRDTWREYHGDAPGNGRLARQRDR